MLLIPNRLLNEDFVTLFYHGLRFSLLKKRLSNDLHGRESYVIRHAISIVKHGEQRITSEDGMSFTIKAGQIGFIPKGLYTVTDLIGEGDVFESFHLFLDVEYFIEIKKMAPSKGVVGVHQPVITAPPLLANYTDSLEHIDKQFESPSELIFDAKIREFFGYLLQEYGQTWLATLFNLYQNKQKADLQAFMNQHFDKPFSISDYAFLTGRSQASFSREFKLKFGTSPRKWLIQHRLEKASKLLQNRNQTVSEVAQQVGFNHVSHFIKSFKNAFGHTPGEHFNQKMIF